MSYNHQEFPNYMQTAGKISVLTAIVGLAVFIFAFIVDVGQQEIQKVSAQTASTSLQVLNTPPTFVIEPFEVTPSSTTTPTNSGDVITWSATGNDANGAPYYLLVCDSNVAPNPTNSGAPTCGGGAVQWGVSVATPSDDPATVSTTTVEAAPFAESNDWYAWVCDGDPTQAECSPAPSQGLVLSAASSSPFNMNSRPTLTSATPAGAINPGDTLTFTSVSSDPDSDPAADNLFLVVCANPGDYNTTTNTCDANFIASTTGSQTDDVNAATGTASILRDGTRSAHAFLVDQHGHEALGSGENVDYTVNNVAPTIVSGDVVLNGGTDIILSNAAAGETTGLTLDFTVTDANSCMNESDTPGSEISGIQAAIYRTSVGTSTGGGCNPTDSTYNPNFCYESSQAPAVWNLNCTATTTSCTGPTDDTIIYECTFPLWFLADPTDDGPHVADSWSAAVAGIDDQFATSSLTEGDTPVPLISAPYFSLVTAEIPYGGLAPGEGFTTLGVREEDGGAATTTIQNIGNTGLDQELDGSAMCPTFVSTSSDCSLAGTSTVFAQSQRFGASAVPYLDAASFVLPTTSVGSPAFLDLNVIETTATSTFAEGLTYWGIEVPSAVTVAGTYTGLNTFYIRTDADW
jgi:hypothetical protein